MPSTACHNSRPMSLNLVLFIAVVIFVVGWFAVGTHYNVRRGEDTLRWLQQGLPLIGEKTTLRWLGSSVVELKIQKAKPPFRDAAVLVVLEPRDVAPLWGLARLRGRRDLLVFRATLQRRPPLEVEAYDPHSWTLGKPARPEAWETVTAPAPLVALASHPPRPELLASAVLEGCALVRFTLSATEPHLETQWRLADVRKHASDVLLQRVRKIADSV